MDNIQLAEKTAVTRIHVEMLERTSHIRFALTCCLSHIIIWKKEGNINAKAERKRALISASWSTCG
jgi:hypothetical protein